MNILFAEKLFASGGKGRQPVVQHADIEAAVFHVEHQRDVLLEEAEQRIIQLAALAEEHEVLTHHANIVEANLKTLVEKVLAHKCADDAIGATSYSDEAITAAAKAWVELNDLARSLKP